MVSPLGSAWKRGVARLSTEPMVHFFFLGALLFLAHRLVVGDQRVIVVSAGVKADLERRFRDRTGRPPSPVELGNDLRAWKRDEALYREALRDHLDRDDATIRTVLADRVRARAALPIPKPVPTAAELERWLATHRSLYETPRRYDYQLVAFGKFAPPPGPRAAAPGTARAAQAAQAAQSAQEQLDRYEQALRAGADPRNLGRPIVGGDLTAEDLQGRFGPGLAARIQSLPVGRWQRLEDGDGPLLARLNAVTGGLPGADELHQRLVVDWSYAERQRAVDDAVQAIVARYHFEERR
jgi:hypothetical protein